jgi:hypothetical protein
MIKDPELLKLAVKAIEHDEKRWDQIYWVVGVATNEKIQDLNVVDVNHCGSTMCLAGHVVNQAGLPLLSADGGWGGIRTGSKVRAGWTLDEGGESTTIMMRAKQLLGLNDLQANQLFSWGGDSVEEFKDHITSVTGVEFE